MAILEKTDKKQFSIENTDSVISEIEQILKYFISDVTEAFSKDPAADNMIQVLTSYPEIQVALKYAENISNQEKIVVIFPDTEERYLSADFWN